MDIFQSIQQIFSDGTSEVSGSTVTDDMDLMAELYNTYFTEPPSELTPVPMTLTPVTSGGSIQEEPKASLPRPNPMSSMNLFSQSIHPSKSINFSGMNSETTVHTSWNQSLDTADINAHQNREEYHRKVQFNYSIQEGPKAPLPHPNPMSSMNLFSQSIHPSKFINFSGMNSETTVHTSWNQSLDTTDINAHQNREEDHRKVQFNYSSLPSFTLKTNGYAQKFSDEEELELEKKKESEDDSNCVSLSSSTQFSSPYTNKRKHDTLKPSQPSSDNNNNNDRKKNGRPKREVGYPKRPLSAYNFFFKAERKRLLKSMPKNKQLMPFPINTKSSTYRATRKGRAAPHHKITFSHLGKQIGCNWKIAPEIVKEKYKLMAMEEKRKYDENLREFKNKK